MRTFKFLFACSLLGLAVFANAQIGVNVNGERVQFTDQEPVMIHDHVMVPIRGVFNKMGITVRWLESTRQVIASNATKTIKVTVGDNIAQVDGQDVTMDVAPTMVNDRVLIPLRFISESLGANVTWDNAMQLVSVNTGITAAEENKPPTVTSSMISQGTVFPLNLDTPLNSGTAKVGDTFTATIDTKNQADYAGLPMGTVIEGHVTAAKPMTSAAPGLLDLKFDRVRMTNGDAFPLDASLISLDDKNIETTEGRMVAKNTPSKDLKYVGYGAGAGVLVSIITKSNLLTDALIGSALGYLFGMNQPDTTKYHEVNLEKGAALGMRLNENFTYQLK